MSSLGRVCAVGIAGNMLISVFLLPVWWKIFSPKSKVQSPKPPISTPSSFYSARIWQIGLTLTRILPAPILMSLAKIGGTIYWLFAAHRREIVIQNLLPVLNDRKLADARRAGIVHGIRAQTRRLVALRKRRRRLTKTGCGLERLGKFHRRARARQEACCSSRRISATGNSAARLWSSTAANCSCSRSPNPTCSLTELRQSSRARRGVETLVVGEDAFAFVEIIRRLQEGATVALLVDRPPAPTAVEVKLFGRKFPASIAAAELARASGCAIVPGYIVRAAGRLSRANIAGNRL